MLGLLATKEDNDGTNQAPRRTDYLETPEG